MPPEERPAMIEAENPVGERNEGKEDPARIRTLMYNIDMMRYHPSNPGAVGSTMEQSYMED